MANPAVLLGRLGFVGLGKEGATQGTPVAATIFPQCETIKPTFEPEYIDDTSLVASAGAVRASYQGVFDGMVELGGFMYPDTFGNFLVAAGYSDTVTGSSSPFTHTFKMPAAGTQPPSYTITWFTGVSASGVAYPGAVLDTLDITFGGPKGACKYSAKFKTWAPVAIAKPTPAYGAINPWLNWQVKASVAGTPIATAISGAVNLKNSTDNIHTMQQVQNPYLEFRQGYECGHKLKAVELDQTLWNHIQTNDQPSLSWSASSSATAILTITSTTTAWKKAPEVQDNSYMKVGDIDITGITNATDVGPVQFVINNTASSAY